MGERIINGIPFDANAIIDQEGEISYDYTLFAEDIAQWLGTYFGNGILVPKAALMTTQFQVSMANETQISINKGNIVINGRTGYLKNPYEMSIDYASVGKQRIDRIVIELNINETVNEFRPLVLKGVESENNPQIPDITRDNYLGIYQMSLANVLVTADGIQNITDERNDSNLCGVSQVLIGVKPAVPVTGDSALNISYDTSYTGVEEKTVQDALDNLYLTKKKILLNGVDQQELKLSTEYQWLEQSILPEIPMNNNNFISYENELYLFSSMSSPPCVYKLNGVLWEKIMSYPDNETYFPVIVGNELFALSKTGVYKVDTTQLSFTKIVNFPVTPAEMPIGVEYNGKLNVVFRYVNSGNTYPHYKLDGTTWTKISEVPTDVYFGTYYSAIGVFNNELHILGGSKGSSPYMATTHIKLNGTLWVNDISLPYDASSDNILIENDNIYFIYYENYYMYRLKDGAWEQYLYLNDLHQYGNILRHKGDFHILGGHDRKGYRKTAKNHFAFKKVLCLED